MAAPFTIRVSDRSDADLDALLAILREAYRGLDPDFLDAGNGFDAEVWGRSLRDPETEWVFLHVLPQRATVDRFDRLDKLSDRDVSPHALQQGQNLREDQGAAVGFAGWRLKPTQCHLHALFVAQEHQRHGYARALLHQHWAAALRREPGIERFTLHVRELAPWARRLYESEGYRYYQPGDERTWPALRVWMDACRQHGTWPLPLGKLLMHRPGSVS